MHMTRSFRVPRTKWRKAEYPLNGGHARLCVFVTAAMLMAPLPTASSAMAAPHHPKGVYAPFADCPLSNPAVTTCVLARIISGELILGKKTVPIDKTITLQGGSFFKNNETLEVMFFGAEDGNTLSKTVLKVPGGLPGVGVLTSATEATVTTELAGPASAIELNITNLAGQTGVAMRLSIMAKLNNRLLGGNCQVGSQSTPLTLSLTTGTTSPPAPNKPIRGSAGDIELPGGGSRLLIDGGSFMDNAFAAPGATGCGAFSPLVNSALGLPSPAGRNTAILNGDVELASAEAVKESE